MRKELPARAWYEDGFLRAPRCMKRCPIVVLKCGSKPHDMTSHPTGGLHLRDRQQQVLTRGWTRRTPALGEREMCRHSHVEARMSTVPFCFAAYYFTFWMSHILCVHLSADQHAGCFCSGLVSAPWLWVSVHRVCTAQMVLMILLARVAAEPLVMWPPHA